MPLQKSVFFIPSARLQYSISYNIMKPTGFRFIFPIAGIYACRMLGLFLLIPIFSIYAKTLHDARPILIGIALGAYGLSQGILQIPFGMLSDKYGRKPVILGGLILFALGSFIGALSHSIYGIILARILQGMGAIGSVLMALLTDLTHDAERTPAMAIIGGTIGLSFNLALILSPIVAHKAGLSGIFYLTLGLALMGMLLLTRIPNAAKPLALPLPRFKAVLMQRPLQRLNLAIFCQHFLFTSTFFVLPIYLRQAVVHTYISHTWQFYLPIIAIAFVLAVPMLMTAEKKGKTQWIYTSAILFTGLSQYLLSYYDRISWPVFCSLMFMYFLAFNALEALLPSLVSKTAKAGEKGTAMGIYSSSQFLGIFAGGSIAGLLAEHYGLSQIFVVNAFIAMLWLLTAFQFKKN